jgi:hypothetical protein
MKNGTSSGMWWSRGRAEGVRLDRGVTRREINGHGEIKSPVARKKTEKDKVGKREGSCVGLKKACHAHREEAARRFDVHVCGPERAAACDDLDDRSSKETSAFFHRGKWSKKGVRIGFLLGMWLSVKESTWITV